MEQIKSQDEKIVYVLKQQIPEFAISDVMSACSSFTDTRAYEFYIYIILYYFLTFKYFLVDIQSLKVFSSFKYILFLILRKFNCKELIHLNNWIIFVEKFIIVFWKNQNYSQVLIDYYLLFIIIYLIYINFYITKYSRFHPNLC